MVPQSGRAKKPRLAGSAVSQPQDAPKARSAGGPVPATAIARQPNAELANEFTPGPIPVPDVRQEGRYVYGIIQSRDPVSFGRMGIGGSGEMVYVVTHGDIGAVAAAPQSSSIPRARTYWRTST